MTVRTFLGGVARLTPFDRQAPDQPVIYLPATPEWNLAGTPVLVIVNPQELDTDELLADVTEALAEYDQLHDRFMASENTTVDEAVALLTPLPAAKDRVVDAARGVAAALRATLAQRDEARAARDRLADRIKRRADVLEHMHGKAMAEARVAELEAALADACDAFDECTNDWAKDLAANDMARWRALVSPPATGDDQP